MSKNIESIRRRAINTITGDPLPFVRLKSEPGRGKPASQPKRRKLRRGVARSCRGNRK